MFNSGLLDLSLFCCISFLFLPHCLSAHITCIVWSSTFYALCTISILCTVPLLWYSTVALWSFFTPQLPLQATITPTSNNNNNNSFSSLYCVFISFVHLVHAMFSIPLHAPIAPIFSTSWVLCVIFIITLQLLWSFSQVSSSPVAETIGGFW